MASLGESTSTSLLDGLQRREPLAWQRLCQLYGPLVYSWCRTFGVAQSDAADIAQEVLRSIHSHIARFRRDQPGHSFRGWFWTITRNKIRDHFRNCAGRPVAIGGTDAQLELLALPDEAIEPPGASSHGRQANSSLLSGLEAVQAEFEDRTWQAFWRTVLDDKLTAQVAEELQISVNAVRLAKSRVLRRLRDEFGKET